MSTELWKLLQNIMGIADRLDNQRDWYNYYEQEKMTQQATAVVLTIEELVGEMGVAVEAFQMQNAKENQ